MNRRKPELQAIDIASWPTVANTEFDSAQRKAFEARRDAIMRYVRGESLKAVEKAIQNSDLGINPNNDGQVIRLVFPQLTEERRKELVKVVKHKAEEGRVAVRNLRRSARHDLEGLERGSEISSDELERAEKELEKLTHEYVLEIDSMVQHKEQELLET